MGVEIERKFLVQSDAWRGAEGTRYCQGYLSSVAERTVRVRTAKDKGYLTIKGMASGASRQEFEYEIPVQEANEMLNELCERPLIEKYRYKIEYGGFIWEVDEFLGDNKGLIIAEIELPSEDAIFEKPAWLGEEVTEDPRYYNANLIKHPFAQW